MSHVAAGTASSLAGPSWATIAVGTATVLVALVGLVFARAQNRRNEILLLRDLRGEWHELKDDWYTALLVGQGPDGYYAASSDSGQRERLRQLIALAAATRPLSGSFRGDKEWKNFTQAREASHEFEQAVRRVVVFLVQIADLVLQGKISPNLAYGIVGHDVVAYTLTCRVLVGLRPSQLGESPDLDGWIFHSGSPGRAERMLALTHLLWAEAARRGDLQEIYFLAAARYKASVGSGVINRWLMRRLSRRAGGSRWTALRLERQLIHSEVLIRSAGVSLPRSSP